ncbi:uncharacterized protein [Centruroides vittatus]|uniref:uncharacterized protein n=1 Tax=Centruroides vittatus TaxID=120091 RepID=UPI00350F5164
MNAGRRYALLVLLLCVAYPADLQRNQTDAPTGAAVECTEDSECGDVKQVECDADTRTCVCKKTNWVLSEGGNCLQGKNLREECVIEEQCRVLNENSTCVDNRCDCIPGYTLFDEVKATTCQLVRVVLTTQTPGERDEDGSGGIKDKNVLIILVVFALMFIGICVALNMFSRARFRNNRSIFSNPHPRLMHIKLGKQKGHRRGSHASMPGGSRQPSVCSQLSPLPSRAGSRRASQQSLRSNPDKRMDQLAGGTVLSVDEIAKKLQESPRRPSSGAAHPVQNGPNSPTIIVTNAPGRGRIDEAGLSSSPVNV